MANDHNGAHSVDPDSTQGTRTAANEPLDADRDERADGDERWDRSRDSRDERSTADRGERRRDDTRGIDHRSVTAAQKDEHGGIKIGSAFFGWLTATGMAVLLTALLVAVGAGVGLANKTDVTKATDAASDNSTTVGIAGAIALLVIVLVAYYCGGYVAGRMARFNGVRQGIAVWVWALVIAVALAILAAVAGDKYNVLSKLNAFPRIPVKEGALTTTGIIALVAVAVASLVGAILGGLAGMHYHRKIDRTPVQPLAD